MRERTARGHDLSERQLAFTQPPRPYHFVWLTTGRTVRIECLVHLSTNLTEGRLRFLLGKLGSGDSLASCSVPAYPGSWVGTDLSQLLFMDD